MSIRPALAALRRSALVYLVAAGLTPIASAAPPDAISGRVTLRPLPPDAPLDLPYWPFTPGEGELTDGLDAIVIDARMPDAGCGALTWSRHPVPGGGPDERYCVALLEGLPRPLLVVGRPGHGPYVITPTRHRTEIHDGARLIMVEPPPPASPAMVAAVRRWAADPEARRR